MSAEDVAPPAASEAPLDDVMLAMDVVDTLRRRERLVQKELDESGREDELKERLRKVYSAQGIEVPDRIIEEAVTALKEDRFTYEPPTDGLWKTLARLYVDRGRWGKWVAGGAAALVVAWAVYWFTVSAPRAALPERLQALYQEVMELSQDEQARSRAVSLLARGQARSAAASRGLAATARVLSAPARDRTPSRDRPHPHSRLARDGRKRGCRVRMAHSVPELDFRPVEDAEVKLALRRIGSR